MNFVTAVTTLYIIMVCILTFKFMSYHRNANIVSGITAQLLVQIKKLFFIIVSKTDLFGNYRRHVFLMPLELI